MSSVVAILCDLGGTHLRLGLGFSSGEVARLRKARLEAAGDGVPGNSVWQVIHDQVELYLDSVSNLITAETPIVLAFPGPVDSEGSILRAPTLVGSTHNVPNVDQISQRLGRRVHVLNDLAAAAWYFRDQSPGRAMVVTVSSGIGSKVFDRNHPGFVFDTPPFSGEIGHLVVDRDPQAPVCDCGERGHLGAIASGRGIERSARRKAAMNHPDFM